MMDIVRSLCTMCPVPLFSGSLTANNREAYEAIIWEDPRPKPTWQELLDFKVPPSPEEVRQQLTDLAESLTLDQQALLAAPILAPVDMALQRGNFALAKLIINNYTFPPELQAVRVEALTLLGE